MRILLSKAVGDGAAVEDLAAVLGADAVTDSPLEVGLRIGLDESVDGANVPLLVTTAVAAGGCSHVFVITADADRDGLHLSVVQNEVTRGRIGHSDEDHQQGPHNDL